MKTTKLLLLTSLFLSMNIRTHAKTNNPLKVYLKAVTQNTVSEAEKDSIAQSVKLLEQAIKAADAGIVKPVIAKDVEVQGYKEPTGTTLVLPKILSSLPKTNVTIIHLEKKEHLFVADLQLKDGPVINTLLNTEFKFVKIYIPEEQEGPATNVKKETSTAVADYILHWDGQSSVLKIDLTFTPAANTDRTTFIFGEPAFGGMDDIFDVVKNSRCEADDSLIIDKPNRRIVVTNHHQKKISSLHYEIDGSQYTKEREAIFTELFRPIISKDILYVVSYFLLMDIDNGAKTPRIKWVDVPKDFAFFNSLSPEKAANEWQDAGNEIAYIIGKDIKIKKYKVFNIPYYSITSKKDTINNMDKELEPFFTNYFPTIRKYWKDKKDQLYFLVVLPMQYYTSNAGLNRGEQYGGFGLGRGFVMKGTGVFSALSKYVVAHETAHYWLGIKLGIGADRMQHQWFIEGFNDYVCSVNLEASQVTADSSFLNYLNKENLKKHYSSKIKDLPNDSIATKFWTDERYQKLPYHRGFIYAFYLDNQIRLASKGKLTLRNFMLDLFAKSKKNEIIELEDFIKSGAKYLPQQQMQTEVQKYMIEGKSIEWKQEYLIPEFKLFFIKDSIPQIKMAEGANLNNVYRFKK